MYSTWAAIVDTVIILVSFRRPSSCVMFPNGEVSSTKMASIFILTDDAVLLILQHLDFQDRIAFAYSCESFRRICMNNVFRKVDLSRRAILRTQRGAIKNFFFMDKQMAQHIKELNISNHRVLNWQMDDLLEEFISVCPNLEALHALNCGMSLQRLHRILKQAPKLTALSWSLRDLTCEDFLFLSNSWESPDGVGLKNIKHLRLEKREVFPHIQILKYLVLSCCKDLEELEIYISQIYDKFRTALGFPFNSEYQIIPGFPQPSTSVAAELQHLHSLTVVAMGGKSYPCSLAYLKRFYKAELSDFVSSVVRKKSRFTKWKKFWVSPAMGISRLQDLLHLADSSLSLHENHPHELHSVKAITVHASPSPVAMDELKTLFQRIDDNTVRSMHLCQREFQANSVLELCDPILRVGRHALKFLSLTGDYLQKTDADINVFLHVLFSNCSNITELDLLYCSFEKDICEPLSKLKHLNKVQLMECAISTKHCNENNVEISKANLLTFVENCKNITDFEVHGCNHNHVQVRCLKDNELEALAKLRNLKSLSLYICGIMEWTFLQKISEHCRFLSMLRISGPLYFNMSHSLLFLESAKFLKHLALHVEEVDLGLEGFFWNLLSCATGLERLCLTGPCWSSLNIPVAVETVKNLPRLHVLHLHSCHRADVPDLRNEMIRMLEEEKSDRSSFFELVLEDFRFMSAISWISKEALPLNEAELCHMMPILAIPRLLSS